MEWDEDGVDDGPAGPLLPPEDRIWRHPSELAAGAASAVRGRRGAGAPSAGPPRVVTVVALTSCLSVLMTLGLVAVVRPFREGADTETATPSPAATGTGSDLTDVAELTSRLRPAIAQVVASNAAGVERWGSGVIFRSDGMLPTAQHIVEGAELVRVVLHDGRELGARLVGGDRDTNIALLDVDGATFETAPLAHGGRLEVGQQAITIGAPRSTEAAGPLVRVSMVSATGQEAGMEGRRLVDMIRTDAAQAPGCSGGAVVDRSGHVIGIAAGNGDTEDGAMGYATPIDTARDAAEQLLAWGRVRRAWMGVEGGTVAEGARVHAVTPDSPASAAGLAAGDVIVALDGVHLASMSALVVALRAHGPGDVVTLDVRRGGALRSTDVTLGERLP